MESINYYQISVFIFQGLTVSILVLLLFHFRKIIGTGLLYATIGMFQFIQVFMASTIYFRISDDLLVSPGSSILFTISLFTILLFYIKEDAVNARKLIYGLVVANIMLVILLLIFRINIEGSSLSNPFNISIDFFKTNTYILFFGTFILFIDSILIIFLFEFVSKHIQNLFLRIFITMSLVLSFDALVFSGGAFWNSENLQNIMISGVISKVFASVFYSILLTIYLKYIQQDIYSSKSTTFKDVYHSLTYRQKYEEAEKAIKLSTSRYRTLINISPVGVFTCNVEGKTTFVNDRCCEISGLSQKQSLNNEWLQAVHPDDRERLQSRWENGNQNINKSPIEYRFLRADGSIRWVLGLANAEYDSANNLLGYIGIITDITDQKLYELELNKLKEKAEESDRLKSSFLANMSHEIRTPMNGILGFAELLKEPVLTGEEQKLYINLIEESGIRMLNLISDIIYISKIESGEVQVFESSVNINEQVNELYESFKPETDRKNIKLTCNTQLSKEQAIINTDKEKINAILSNLIKNAIKYTSEGSISFGCKHQGEFLEFYVKDTGIGISEDKQEHIFKRFMQADGKNNYAIEGTGIGLSIAKAYTEVLGGKIWVVSNKDKGSGFYFTIPFKQNSKTKSA